MSTERTTGQADDVTDDRVSGTYRQVAVERAPASLNERVLRDARAHAGRGYSWWMAWLRPMAWAATVGLCLAIVVELSNAPMPDDASIDVPPARRSLPSGSPREQDLLEPEIADEQARPQLPARKNETEVVGITGSRPATLATPAASERRDERTGRALPSSATEAKASADTDDTDIFNPTDAPIVEEAAEMARMREGPGPDPAGNNATRSVTLQADAAFEAVPQNCDDDARSTPESWIECILEIENRGDSADDERKALRKTFPDAELP